jgi:hypothetical protein
VARSDRPRVLQQAPLSEKPGRDRRLHLAVSGGNVHKVWVALADEALAQTFNEKALNT